jgi:hypothetical protein
MSAYCVGTYGLFVGRQKFSDTMLEYYLLPCVVFDSQ